MIIHMRNVADKPLWRALDEPLLIIDQFGAKSFIPRDYEWNGSSVPRIFQGLFPRQRHPVASCRHDWRCGKARTKEDRAFADRKFKEDVGKTSWKITSSLMYAGVRIGAFFKKY